MRIIIVITVPPPDYKLWGLTEKWDVEQKFEKTQVRVAAVGADRILVLCQAESTKRNESDAMLEIRRVTTPWVYDIANSGVYAKAEKVYVAAHHLYVNLSELPLNITDNRYVAGAYFHHEISQPNSRLFEDLVDLLERTNQDTFETALETIVGSQDLSRQQRLAVLKYQLAHVFLPVTIELHTWREVDLDDDQMKEILNSSVESEERMDRARSLVYEQAASPGADTIEKLVKEAELEDSSNWRDIQTLLPRRDPRFYQSRDVSPFSILDSFHDKQTLKALRTRILENDKTFADWTNQVESALVDLAADMD